MRFDGEHWSAPEPVEEKIRFAWRGPGPQDWVGLNAQLNRWETIKKFSILPRDLSIEDGELTPSMKIKRRIVEKSFAPQIEELYAGTVAEL